MRCRPSCGHRRVQAGKPSADASQVPDDLDSHHTPDPAVRRVLVASADAPARDLAARTLRRGWFEVTCVSDGLVVLDMLHRGEHDLVVLDAALPCLGAISLCRWVRLHGPDRDLPVVVWAHNTEQEATARQAGASSVIGDPLLPRLLRHRATAVLRDRMRASRWSQGDASRTAVPA